MKLKDFKRQKDIFLNKTVKVTLHNGQKYRGSFFYENERVKVGNGNILVKDIETIEILSDNTLYKYVSVSYDDDYAGRTYSYKTTIDNISIGDTVLVDRNGNEAYGTIEDINYYTEKDAPYPVEKTKDIIEIVDEFEYDDEDYDYEDRLIDDYKNMLLNNIFGRISIKRLMKLNSPQNGEDEYKLLYYPKFNTFFYKVSEDDYKMAEYYTKVMDNQMFRIIEKESIEVPQKRYAMTSDSDAYVRAVNFCRDNMISFHDDTDILEYCDEKKELYKNSTKLEEPKDFETIDEIKEYLKNYKEAEYRFPNPPYYIENNEIIHYMGGLVYDWRIFKIPKFLKDNNYIDEKYYNLDNYPHFFNENRREYDFENLDIGRVSYLLLRVFNVERISEGAIDDMASSGIMLKLVERAETLKK